MASLGQPPKAQFFAGDGKPLVGGKVYTYVSYSSIPLATYTDPTKISYNPNPVILDSRGEAGIWANDSQFKIIVYDANDVFISSSDTYPPTPATMATFYNDAGGPLSYGRVYTYEAGTSTLSDTYVNATEDSINSNPVILNLNGQANLWFGPNLYKIILKTANDVEIYSVDNYGA